MYIHSKGGLVPHGMATLGQSQVPQYLQTGATGTAIVTTAMIAHGTISTASALYMTWIPIIGPVIAGVTIGLSLLFARKGPRQKIATTKIVEAVIPLLQKNLEGYMEGPQTPESQAQALANFDAGWRFIVEHCDIPEMGDPGQRCVNERNRGGVYDMFRDLRDPIANDPAIGSAGGGVFLGTGVDGKDLLIGGALLVGAALLAAN